MIVARKRGTYQGVRGEERGHGRGQGFLKGAIIISLGNFTAKAVGALSRIPLTAFLGAEGVGLYQLAYPFYCLLLTISSSGLPSGLSRIVAAEVRGGGDGRATFQTAARLFFFIGFVGSLAMFALRGVISNLQGEDLRSAYIALSPAVTCVALLSVFRGYFQGKCDMVPTALSDVIEQLVKGGAAIALAYIFRADVKTAVTAVLAAVSLSEVCALGYMLFLYCKEKPLTPLYKVPCPGYGHILSLTLPVAAAAAVLPLSQFIDSGLGVRLLKQYAPDAVSLYGLYAGGAVTLVGLPVSICYGFAVSVIPRLGHGDARAKALKSLAFTIAVSLPCALALWFFARPLGGLFFRRLDERQLDILELLVKILSPTAVTHACAQTLSACLIGRGKAIGAAVNMSVGAALKTVFVFFLVRMENISVYGMAIAANVCYFTAFVLNLYQNLKAEKDSAQGVKKR